jgi:hypothetical protein
MAGFCSPPPLPAFNPPTVFHPILLLHLLYYARLLIPVFSFLFHFVRDITHHTSLETCTVSDQFLIAMGVLFMTYHEQQRAAPVSDVVLCQHIFDYVLSRPHKHEYTSRAT